jgi:hypothetical protein
MRFNIAFVPRSIEENVSLVMSLHDNSLQRFVGTLLKQSQLKLFYAAFQAEQEPVVDLSRRGHCWRVVVSGGG